MALLTYILPLSVMLVATIHMLVATLSGMPVTTSDMLIATLSGILVATSDLLLTISDMVFATSIHVSFYWCCHHIVA